jgi:CheY-like chemotaxis protein
MLPRRKRLLLIAENGVRAADISELLAGEDLDIVTVADLSSARKAIARESFDGVVLDWVLPDAAGLEFIEYVQSRLTANAPPIVVSGSLRLSEDQIAAIHQSARRGAVRYAPTIERLLHETVLLLHRKESALSAAQQKTLSEDRHSDPTLTGRKVLVIDDDLRNIFALTSVLEQHGLKVLHADNGRAGIELLRSTKDVDVVLMDIMMPDMDGYETTRAIRQLPEFASLPVIALTAKAMKGDREKCLLAGASDYVTKPVDLPLLFSVLRVWIARDSDNRFEHGALAIPDWLADHDLVVDDDRDVIAAGDRVLLIVEDDVTFARIMVELAHEQGLKALIALRGSTAMTLAREFQPGAITLDVQLPDMSGWTVLDHLKHDPATRHIPVHIISGDENNRRGFVLGALSCTQKASGKEPLVDVFDAIQSGNEPPHEEAPARDGQRRVAPGDSRFPRGGGPRVSRRLLGPRGAAGGARRASRRCSAGLGECLIRRASSLSRAARPVDTLRSADRCARHPEAESGPGGRAPSALSRQLGTVRVFARTPARGYGPPFASLRERIVRAEPR